MILLDQVDVLLDNIYTIKILVLILDVLLDIYTIKILVLILDVLLDNIYTI